MKHNTLPTSKLLLESDVFFFNDNSNVQFSRLLNHFKDRYSELQIADTQDGLKTFPSYNSPMSYDKHNSNIYKNVFKQNSLNNNEKEFTSNGKFQKKRSTYKCIPHVKRPTYIHQLEPTPFIKTPLKKSKSPLKRKKIPDLQIFSKDSPKKDTYRKKVKASVPYELLETIAYRAQRLSSKK
eukprot:TRINITY_DN1868_c0_g1_i1.p1 TRINITY_DN1868_c0_g1~~TRINITY_DN1868_c0_g1_i1.p1  ORF type:complete len:181 (-),score=38.31 TRINITY_DN1868_c0_g1_i1:263-805(-)